MSEQDAYLGPNLFARAIVLRALQTTSGATPPSTTLTNAAPSNLCPLGAATPEQQKVHENAESNQILSFVTKVNHPICGEQADIADIRYCSR